MNQSKYINLDMKNIDHEDICCGKDERRQAHGTEIKKTWLKSQFEHGHVFRKLNGKTRAFIEYGPLENELVPIIGNNYMYVYCFWVEGFKKNEYGKELLEYAINDAREKDSNGLCLVLNKQKMAFLPDGKNLKKYGFEKVGQARMNYELWVLKFREAEDPKFTEFATKNKITEPGLVIYYNDECPLIYNSLVEIKDYTSENNIKLSLHYIDSAKAAKNMPCFMNNFMVFYNGKFLTHEVLNRRKLKGYLEKDRTWLILAGALISGTVLTLLRGNPFKNNLN